MICFNHANSALKSHSNLSLYAVFLALLIISAPAKAETVINIDMGYRGNPTQMTNPETAGVIPRTNWTTIGDANVGNPSGTVSNLQNAAGVATTASVTYSTNDNWRNDTGDNTAGDRHMMYGFHCSGNNEMVCRSSTRSTTCPHRSAHRPITFMSMLASTTTFRPTSPSRLPLPLPPPR